MRAGLVYAFSGIMPGKYDARETMSIEVVPLEAGLGAEVRGLDIREPLAADTVAAILSLIHI